MAVEILLEIFGDVAGGEETVVDFYISRECDRNV